MIRRPPRSTLFPYTTALPISLDQLHAVVDRLGVDLGAVHVGEPRQIVERVDETLHHVRLGPGPHFGALLRGALAKVVVLSSEPEVLVLQLGNLAFEAGPRLLRQLDERAFGGGGGGGGVHRPPLLCRLWRRPLVLPWFPLAP